MSCDPQELATLAKCFQCLDRTQAEAIRNYLLCQINEGGGAGGGAIQLYSTTDADPTGIVTPADPTKAATFYQDPSITLYNEWKWSIEEQAWYQTIAPL